MARRKRKQPTYRKHRNGQGFTYHKGRFVYFGKYGTTEAREAFREFLNSIDSESAQAEKVKREAESANSHQWTIEQLVAHYLQYAEGYYTTDRTTGEKAGGRAALRYLIRLFGGTPVDEFRVGNLTTVRDSMIRGDHSEKPLSRKYVNSLIVRIRRCFDWAAERDFIAPETAIRLQALKPLKPKRSAARETDRIEPPTCRQLLPVLQWLRKHRPEVADMIRVHYLSGCRPGEIIKLRPNGIDRSGTTWVYDLGDDHKTAHHNRSRFLVFSRPAQRILSRYLEGEYCFTSKGGRPFTVHVYRRLIARACERMSVDQWSPNQLRHFGLTHYGSKMGLEAARVIAGHSSTTMTRRYAQRSDRDLIAAQRVLAEVG